MAEKPSRSPVEAPAAEASAQKRLFLRTSFDFYDAYSQTRFPAHTPVEIERVSGLLQAQIDAGLAVLIEE